MSPFPESPDSVKLQRVGDVGHMPFREGQEREHLTGSLVPKSCRKCWLTRQLILIFSWELGGEDRGGGAKHFCSRMQID